MNKNCPRCDQDFMIEPGFYFGAMFVSYGFNVAITVMVILAYFFWFSSAPLWIPVVAATIIALGVAPLNFRLSRVLMLHFFGGVKYWRN